MDLQMTSHLAAALMSGMSVFNQPAESATIVSGDARLEKLPKEDVAKEPAEEEKEESGEEFSDEESEIQAGSSTRPGRGVTLQMLLEEKMLEPGIAAMTIEYLGQKFVADLLPDGKIKSHETETIFCSPSAWAIHCKRIINPDKRSGCGWASVKYRGKKLDTIKGTYLRKKSLERENMHSDEEEEEMEVESPPEPPPQRVVTKHNTVPNRMMQHDANMLTEAVSFSSVGKVQPFLVSISSNAFLILDLHCHLKKEEVYGYLAGSWDLNNHNMVITHTFPCLINKNDHRPRVMVELEIQMEIEKLGMNLLGWYHSHPTNPAMPSLRDCDNQLEYQIKMRGPSEISYIPCIGVICSPYNPESPVLESSMTCFWVTPPPEQRPTEYPRPLLLQYNVLNDSHLSPHAHEQIKKSIKYYFTFSDDTSVQFKENFKPDITFLDKLKSTLTPKFPKEQSDGLLWHFIREELGCSSEQDDKMDLDALLAVPQPIPVSKSSQITSVPNFPSVSTLQQMVSRPAGVPPINVSSGIGVGSPHKFESPAQLNIPVLPPSSKSSKSSSSSLSSAYPSGLDMLTSMALGLGTGNMSLPLGSSSLESLAAANSMLSGLAPGLSSSLTASLTGSKLADPPSYAASLQNLTSSIGSYEKTSANTATSTTASAGTIPASIASNLMMSSADIANALFSATKYSNAGILGIPDPMSQSTLAANNMFLSPSLLKMQESLMKPLSNSGSTKSSSYDKSYDKSSSKASSYDKSSTFDKPSAYDKASTYDKTASYDKAAAYEKSPAYEKSSSYDKPSSYEKAPAYEKSSYDKSAYDKSSYDKSTYDKSTYDKSAYDKSPYDKPAYDKSAYDKSAYDKSSYDKSAYDKSGYDKSAYDKSGYDKSVYDPSALMKSPHDLMKGAKDYDMMKAAKDYEIMKATKDYEILKGAKDYDLMKAAKDYDLMKAAKDYDLMKAAKDYLPPDFGSIGKGKIDNPLDVSSRIETSTSVSTVETGKSDAIDSQVTDFSMSSRSAGVSGESFLSQMLELTKKTTMPDYMPDYGQSALKLSKTDDLGTSMPPSSHSYLGSSVADTLSQVSMGNYSNREEPYDYGKEQDYSMHRVSTSESEQ